MRITHLFALIAFTLVTPLRFTIAAETNHNFARWEKEIAAFEASDRTNPPPKHCLLFTGSSTIRKWTTLAQDYPGQPVVNRGVGGSGVVDITHFVNRILFPYEPKMIFFRCGGNDLAAGKSVEQVFSDFKEFVVGSLKIATDRNRFHFVEPDDCASQTKGQRAGLQQACEGICETNSASAIL